MGRSAVATGVGGVHGFPVALTSFIGRSGAVREVARLLEEYRLVTITGPGGSGKTRPADQVAWQVAVRFADGVWLAELAAVWDPAQVAVQGGRSVCGVSVSSHLMTLARFVAALSLVTAAWSRCSLLSTGTWPPTS